MLLSPSTLPQFAACSNRLAGEDRSVAELLTPSLAQSQTVVGRHDASPAGEVSQAELSDVLERVLAYSEQEDWKGYDKHDGLNCTLVRALFGWNRWTRLIAIQAMMRSPINLRPLLRQPKVDNPKGLALFVLGSLDRYALAGAPRDLQRARALIARLDRLAVPVTGGAHAWGYQYPWQDLGFYAPAGTPNAVVTAFVCEALLAAHRSLGESDLLARVAKAIPFFLGGLRRLKDEPDELCLSYMPVDMRMRVLDVSILIAAVLAEFARQSGEAQWREPARRLAGYVVHRQTSYHAWFYTDPPNDSPIRHDNYHTGFILDALWRYMQASGDMRWEERYWNGMDFYAEHLFEPSGAPRWMSDRAYPYDIHGAAQGILSFTRHPARYGALAQRIARWTLDEMYDPQGRFYYQRTRWYTKRFTFLRWCNAWMVRGLAALAQVQRHDAH